MLTTQGYAGLFTACYNDVVGEAGKRGNAADEEGGDGAPVGGKFGRVAVDTVKVVHVRYGHVPTSDDVIAAARDRRISGLGRGEYVRLRGRTQL